MTDSRANERSALEIRADATYFIPGGAGGLGLTVARWLLDRGARHLVLTGRRTADATLESRLEPLRAAGAEVRYHAVDLADGPALEALLQSITQEMPPLRGIVHSAGVLDDGVLVRQSWPRFVQAMAPKLEGAWLLHSLTRSQDLDFFVLFSSASVLLCNPGQGSYVASNTFLDALANLRRAEGLPALCIDWGYWAELGMSPTAGSAREKRWMDAGFSALSLEQGLGILDLLLSTDATQATAAPIDWKTLARTFPGGLPRRFRGLEPTEAEASLGIVPAGQGALFARLEPLAPQEGRRMLLQELRQLTAKVLGLDPSRLPESRRPLGELGLDSLMAIELKNALSSALGRSLPATLLFNYPTLEALTGYVSVEVLGWSDPPDTPLEPRADHSTELKDEQAELERIQQLSEAEAEALLEQQLAKLLD